jgi:uncharacterized protein (DUF4415 family)
MGRAEERVEPGRAWLRLRIRIVDLCRPRREVHMKRQSKQEKPSRGRADLERLRRIPDSEVRDSSPPELAGLPHDFWDTAVLVEPVRKQAISLRVDEDVLTWFKECGPRYQSRMNAVLRSYMHSRSRGRARP